MKTLQALVLGAALTVAPLQADAQQIRIRIGENVSPQHTRFWTALPYQQDWGQYRNGWYNGNGIRIFVRAGDFSILYDDHQPRRIYTPRRTHCRENELRRRRWD